MSLIVSLSVSKSCTVSCTKETVLGLQQVDMLSHLQTSEQAIWADEQLHICEEHGLSLLQLLLINLSISEGVTSTLLRNDTGQYASGRPSDVLSIIKSIQLWWILLQCNFPNTSLNMSPL